MSFHQIEDFVEDAIRVVGASSRSNQQKRELIAGLYRWHDLHDVSWTRGRVADVLISCGYSVADEERLIEAPAARQRNVPVAEQFLALFEIASNLKPEQLPELDLKVFQREAYAMMVHGDREGLFGDDLSLALDFDDWLNDPTSIKIRAFAEANHATLTPAFGRFDLGGDPLPTLRDALDEAAGWEEEAIVRLQLDIKRPLDKVIAAIRRKQKRATARRELGPLEQVPEFFAARLGADWQVAPLQITEDGHHFVFLGPLQSEDIEEPHCLSLMICIWFDRNIVELRVGAQFQRLLRWQQREPSVSLAAYHGVWFTRTLIEAEGGADAALLNDVQFWDCNPKSSSAHTNAALEDIWQFYAANRARFLEGFGTSLERLISDARADPAEISERIMTEAMTGFSATGRLEATRMIVAGLHKEAGDLDRLNTTVEEIKAAPVEISAVALRKARIKQAVAWLTNGEGCFPELPNEFELIHGIKFTPKKGPAGHG